jgi:hypothetical protein
LPSLSSSDRCVRVFDVRSCREDFSMDGLCSEMEGGTEGKAGGSERETEIVMGSGGEGGGGSKERWMVAEWGSEGEICNSSP